MASASSSPASPRRFWPSSRPIGLFNNLKLAGAEGALDVKKGGIFPIVHGVRALAIEQGLEETNTFERLAKLSERGLIKEDFARGLAQALDYLLTLRLDAQLAASDASSLFKPGALTSMDRDLLRDSFQQVKQLRDLVRRRFNLNMFCCGLTRFLHANRHPLRLKTLSRTQRWCCAG